jgi:WD40 repeat protein
MTLNFLSFRSRLMVAAVVAIVALAAVGCRHAANAPGAIEVARPQRVHDRPELVVQTGHNASVRALAFSADGRLLASGGWDRLVKLWDLASRRELDSIEAPSDVNAVALSPDGRFLAIGSGDYRDGTLALYDVRTGALRATLGKGARKILALAFSPDGTTLASGGVIEREADLVLWDVATGEARARLKGHTAAISDLAFTADGTTLVSGSWDGKVKAWDPSRPSAKARDIGALGTDRAGALAVGGETLVFDEGGSLAVFNAKTGTRTAKVQGEGPLTVTRDGRLVAHVAGKGDVVIRELATGRVVSKIPAPGTLPTPALAFSADAGLLAIGTGGEIALWDPESGRATASLSGTASYFAGAGFASGAAKSLVSLGGDLVVSLWDLTLAERTGSLALPKKPGSRTLPLSVARSAPRALVADASGRTWRIDVTDTALRSTELPALPNLTAVAISGDGRYAVRGTDRGRVELWSLDGPARGGELSLAPLTTVHAVALDGAGAIVAASENAHVVVRPRAGGAAVATGDLDDTISAVALSANGTALAAGTFSGELALWRLDGARLRLEGKWRGAPGKVRSLAFSGDGRRLAASGTGRAQLWDLSTRTGLAEFTGHVGGVPSASFGADDALVATAGWDGRLAIFGANGTLRARLVAIGAHDFVIATPEHFYRASRGGLRGVAFRHRDRVFPFEQFDLALNRPAKVLESLGLAPAAVVAQQHALTERRLAKMGATGQSFDDEISAPALRVVTPPPLVTKARTVSIEVLAEAPAHGLDRVLVWANDVPVFGARGLDVSSSGKALRRTIDIDLANGENKLQLAAVDRKGTESLRTTFVVRNDGPAAPRDLYLVLAGVSDYGNPDRNLGYPAKDVRDLSAAFAARKGRYRAIHELALVDRAATKDALLAARAFLARSKPDDLVVVFVAGHGVLDERGGWAFATADVDFSRPTETGLSFDALEDLVDGIGARNKLVLVDTCHAGELDDGGLADATARLASAPLEGGAVRMRGLRAKGQKPPATSGGVRVGMITDLFADLRRGSGATVIAAAGGAELAYESATWNNGVFTHAVLEGFARRRADLDGDGAVRASELRDFVVDTVRRLTLGVQVPVMRRENVEADFRVD